MAFVTNLTYNPSFSLGLDGWAVFGGGGFTAIAIKQGSGFYGSTNCLEVTKYDATAGSFACTIAKRINVTVGSGYSLSAYVKVSSGLSATVKIGIDYVNTGGTTVGSVYYSSSLVLTETWQRISVSAVAPATAVKASITIVNEDTNSSGSVYFVDAIQFENSYDPTPYVEPLTQNQETSAVNDTLRPVPIPHLTGMELNADIMLNNLLLNTIDYNKCVWVCTGLEGWWDMPDPEVPDLTRGLDDGSYDVRGRWTARNLTLTGSILVPNKNYVTDARDRLINAINLVKSGGWLLVGESPTKAAYVRLSGKPDIQNVNARGRINFSIGLRAANPLKLKWNWGALNGYESSTVSAGSSAVVSNSGNAAVPTILTLTGPLTQPITIGNSTSSTSLKVVKNLRAAGYSKALTKVSRTGTTVTLTVASGHGFIAGDIINIDGISDVGYTTLNSDNSNTVTSVTTTTIVYTSSSTGTLTEITLTAGATINLVSADVLKIDTYNRSVLLNDSATVARSYVDTKVDWISLNPGNNTITFTPTAGSTTLDVKYRSGWIG